jgi:SAM-dependent methyltransferase
VGTEAVRDYWQENPCAAGLARAEPGSPGFYADVEQAKLRLEPHEVAFADFPAWRGRDVLEIGCGVGVDTTRFARAGAYVTAIDLTDAAVSLARGLLALEHLDGTVIVADAESLPFADESFDLVYSWGVLHHTPDIGLALAEARRVLRPGGEARVMLYGRRSLFAGAVWARQVVRERRPMSPEAALARGLESPGTQAFTRSEAAALFAGFADVEVRQVATSYDRLPVDRLGWHLLVRAGRGAAPAR